jgi:hypothetical protein
MIDWTTQILLKWKGIDDLIQAVDQGMDDCDGAGEGAARLCRGGGSSEPGVAHATGHCFWWNLTLWTWRIHGTHLGGPWMAGATRVGRATPVGLLQPLATSRTSSNGRPPMRLGYAGAAWHVGGWHGVGSAWRGLQRSEGELGRRLGFQYLRIEIRRRTGTIYRVFLYRIVDGKDPNTSLVWIEFCLMKIWKKSKGQ